MTALLRLQTPHLFLAPRHHLSFRHRHVVGANVLLLLGPGSRCSRLTGRNPETKPQLVLLAFAHQGKVVQQRSRRRVNLHQQENRHEPFPQEAPLLRLPLPFFLSRS